MPKTVINYVRSSDIATTTMTITDEGLVKIVEERERTKNPHVKRFLISAETVQGHIDALLAPEVTYKKSSDRVIGAGYMSLQVVNNGHKKTMNCRYTQLSYESRKALNKLNKYHI